MSLTLAGAISMLMFNDRGLTTSGFDANPPSLPLPAGFFEIKVLAR